MSEMKLRAQTYRLLSRLYILEADETFLKELGAMTFPESEGFSLLKSYLSDLPENAEEDLAVDYARIFLAAGVATGLAAFPYESIYTGKKKLMNQSSAGECEKFYAAKGLKARGDMYKIPNDHIGLQCEYMAFLIEEGCDMAEQKIFFDAHMKKWIPLFVSDVIKYASTDFYKALGAITREFMESEKAYLENAE
ncbi:MAG: molecular chaperone TorD family protein [Parasporobacterium sp.]|nr:molecular chaperone TorD family protein [Parasporobacterium sp.]